MELNSIPSPDPKSTDVVGQLLRKLSERSKEEQRKINMIKMTVESALIGLVEKSDSAGVTYLYEDAQDVKTLLLETLKNVGIKLAPGRSLIFNNQVSLGKEYVLVKDTALGTTSVSKKPHVGFKINAFVSERYGRVVIYYSAYKMS